MLYTKTMIWPYEWLPNRWNEHLSKTGKLQENHQLVCFTMTLSFYGPNCPLTRENVNHRFYSWSQNVIKAKFSLSSCGTKQSFDNCFDIYVKQNTVVWRSKRPSSFESFQAASARGRGGSSLNGHQYLHQLDISTKPGSRSHSATRYGCQGKQGTAAMIQMYSTKPRDPDCSRWITVGLSIPLLTFWPITY